MRTPPRLCLLGTTLALLGPALDSRAAEPAGNVTFAASFDGDTAATQATGEPKPRAYGEIRYVPGVVGQAVVLGGPRRLVYGGAGNVPATAATLSFWAKPLDWSPVTEKFIFFVTLVRPEPDRLARLLLYKVYNSTSVTLLAESGDVRDTRLLHSPAASWQPGEWRHFTLAWDSQQTCIYANGVLAASGVSTRLPAAGWAELMLGTSYPSWAYVGTETTAFDALVIRDRVLGPDEVKAAFDQSRRRNPELAAAFDAAAQRREQRCRENLARAGGFILASSFADYKDNYPDNLLDGDPNSTWRPKEPEFPQWLELRWRYPVRIDKVAFEAVSPHELTAASVQVFRDGQPAPVKAVSGPELPTGTYKEIAIPELTTDRLRLVLEAGTAGFPQLAELEAFGPPQPLVGRNEPYWDAWYTWYPEPDRVHKANAPRYFRKTFELPDLTALGTAFLLVRSNDYYKIFVNGTEIATGSIHIRPLDVKAALRPGRNAIAAVADLGSNPGQWGWGEFLAELSLNYPGRSDRIGTDATWRVHDAEVAGWQQPGFDDSGWVAAAPYVRPPGGPWGRIPYVCTSVREAATVTAVTVTPSAAKPGQTVSVQATLRADAALRGDYFFVFELAEPAVHPEYGDFSVARTVVEPPVASSRWTPSADAPLAVDLRLPEFAPNGRVPLRLRAIERNTGVELDLRNATGGSGDEVGAVIIDRYPARALRRPAVSGALSFRNGQAGLRVGREVRPPLFWRYCPLNSFERAYHYAADTGVHTHHFIIYPHVIDLDRETWQRGFAELDQNITSTLRVDPQADLMVLVDLRPTNAWLKANPGERLINGFGALGPVSYASQKHEQEVHAYLRALIAFLKAKPYYGRVTAIKPMTCGVPDSGLGGVEINTWQTDRGKITVGDYNPQAIAAFRDWLRTKYHGDAARLRQAWNDPAVTCDAATPVLAELLEEGENGGVFRDPTKGRMTFDYFEFLPGLLGRFYQRLAKLIKDETDGKVLVMIHYGYVIGHVISCNNPGSMFQNNNFDLPAMLADPNIDAYLGAIDYDRRRAGDPYTLYFPVDSINLHRRQYIADGDYRTFLAEPVIHGRLRSARETEAVLQKDFASAIIGSSGTWLSDMGSGASRSAVPWFLDRSITDTVRQMNALWNTALKTPRRSVSDIAVFLSTTTPKYHDAYYASTLYRNLVVWTYWRELHRLGAPFDCFLMSDLGHPDLRRDYKLYVFLNPFFMSASERHQVEDLKRDGKTLLWFYAPGYIDDQRGLSPAHIAEVTGIQVSKRADKELMRCTVTATAHPITAGLKPDHAYAALPSGYPETDQLHPAAFGPVFRVTDPAATTLATYADGAAAFAVRDFGSWRSVYTAVPYLDVATLRNLARFAGVHLYCDQDVILDADNRFVMLHNGYGAAPQLTLHLPGPCRVTDALSGELLAKKATKVPLQLPECTTRILRLEE